MEEYLDGSLNIAIVGMAARFPGAENIEQFWENLCAGKESIHFFTDDELKAAGVSQADLENPNYVKAAPILKDIEFFDAAFFDYTPGEASFMDPQQRILLECAWEALEHAGYAGNKEAGPIGVYAGVKMNTYIENFVGNDAFTGQQDRIQIMLGNAEFALSTRIAYKFDLTGPCYMLQTACSTSLAAVHLACQGLLLDECRMALAGAVAIEVPHKVGYHYEEFGAVASPDGHCRPFDAQAQGTIFGSGVGAVVLKRLADALADGDYVYAVIKGTAVNNDGAVKASFTAPSVDGQTKAIMEALACAGVAVDSISYVEAHGAGTPLGDPIEIMALVNAFRAKTDKKQFCPIGSVKGNVGHLDAASGMAGLIKTVMALKHRMIPPSLHFEHPNPEIDFANSPFFVNTELTEWKSDGLLRHAGVNSLGFGGTNTHVILEEAPPLETSGESRPAQLVVLSAKSRTALDAATVNLANHLQQKPNLNLADVAYTLQVGRQAFNHRRVVVCHNLNDAVSVLETQDPQRIFNAVSGFQKRPVVFLLPGMGDQYVNMARGLYQAEPTFCEYVDRCSEVLKPLLDLDIREVLYPEGIQPDETAQESSPTPRSGTRLNLRKLLRRGDEQADSATQTLNQTHLAHPILFAIEYALAQLWMEWGVHPQAMIGHSIGEYVAACLAGVFSLEDVLLLVATRAQMIQKLPGGAMLAVFLPEEEIQPLLHEKLSLSAVNAPSSCVISGPTEAVADLQQQLIKNGVACQCLQTTHAFHSAMMNPIVEPFTEQVKQFILNPPEIPYLSNITGTWITADEATDPTYWARHLCQTVRFAEGMQELLKEPEQILLEIGPGMTLSTLAAQRPDKKAEQVVLSSLRHPHDPQSDITFLLTTLGRLWLADVSVNWPGFYAHERRHRLPLPTYPFERQRYWIEQQETSNQIALSQSVRGKNRNIARWFFTPTWQPTPPLSAVNLTDTVRCWLVFMDNHGLGTALVERLHALQQKVVTVRVGGAFGQNADGMYTLNPQNDDDDYVALVRQLKTKEQLPDIVAHLWSMTTEDTPSDLDFFNQFQNLGYYSLLFLTRALAQEAPEQATHIGVFANNIHDVSGDGKICPEKATLSGLCKVIPQEHEHLSCAYIDVVPPQANTRQEQQLVDYMVDELTTDTREVMLAYRQSRRWVQHYIPTPLYEADPIKRPLRERGVYLITGGLGNVAYLIGHYLAQTVQARLVLSSRSGLPPRSEWANILTMRDDKDDMVRRIRFVQTLEDLGAEVMIAQADITNERQMRHLITQTYDRFGQLNGVLHMAGVTSGPSIFKQLTEIGRVESEIQFSPKVHGLYVLEKVLADQKLDFCLLFSSNSTVLGGMGFSTYAAANAFMDAFAVSRNQTSSISWLSANWDPWPEVTRSEKKAQSSFDQYTMTPEEGQEAFRRVACLANEGQEVVITGDLAARLDLWIKQASSKQRQVTTLHERPALAHDYVAPRNETEQVIADVWIKVLGIKQIGVHDNFFELGGHSMLLPQIIDGLRHAFKSELPVRSLFEYTTVAGLAQFIESGGGQMRGKDEKPIAERIRTVFPTERKELIRTYLKQKIAMTLDLEVDQLPENGNLSGADREKISVDLIACLKQDFQIQLFSQEIQRIPSIQAMTDLVMTEFERVEDLSRLATTNPLSAYTLQPYRKQSLGHQIRPPQKNKPMTFVLCSPRSGSTLLRIMLAGHPDLFCPPELYLLHFETIQEWDQHVGFGDIFAWNRQGLEVAFGELLDIESEASRAHIDKLIEQNESVYRVYGCLQELAAGRLLVDQTPTYALDMEALTHAERLFEVPKYIHLIRHPYAVIESFLRARLDKLLGPDLFKEADVDPYVVAETVWTMCNRQTQQFLTSIEPERRLMVRYEELVSTSAEVMTRVCEFLGVPFDEAVLHPYDNPMGPMTGSIGDPNIFQHKAINPERGNAWQKIKLPRYLDASTQQLARELDYELSEKIDLRGSVAQLLSAALYANEEQLPINFDELSDEQVDHMLSELLEKKEV